MAVTSGERFGYVCCFCGNEIVASGDDPLAIILDGGPGSRQALYCHVLCLRRVTHPSVPLLFDGKPDVDDGEPDVDDT